MAEVSDPIRSELAALDRRVAAQGLDIWVGGEPTFTDRFSMSPEWLTRALGGDKCRRAARLAARMLQPFSDCVAGAGAARALLLRTIGRQYPGEETPRWSFGLWARRDGAAISSVPHDPLSDCVDSSPFWDGWHADPPPATDPLSIPADHPACQAAAACQAQLAEAMRRRGLAATTFETGDALSWRVVCSPDPRSLEQVEFHPDARRLSIHERPTPKQGLADTMAQTDRTLFAIGVVVAPTGFALRIELPRFDSRLAFERAMQAIGESTQHVSAVLLTGFTPPVDEDSAFMTVTPDPAVIEVNMAPSRSLSEYYDCCRALAAAAAQEGLSSVRHLYNGDVADSGGGGHVTLGGPDPARSPFLLEPRLLPRLVCYINRHPSLSYLFAVDSLGGSSQSPRADEGDRDSFNELRTALAVLERSQPVRPDMLWATLAPFMCDKTGNSHRTELNVEKLANPFFGERGGLGLVECRAFRMGRTPARCAAVAALMRAVTAMLAKGGEQCRLVDWGDALHDRWALPSLLEDDLRVVLAELAVAGLELGPAIERELFSNPERKIGEASCGELRISLRRAMEFWPLIGDSGSQEQGTARFIDGSTLRVELRVEGPPADLMRTRVLIRETIVPLELTETSIGAVGLLGIRYRSFAPVRGLHPALLETPILSLIVECEQDRVGLEWHDWIPGGGAYDGLPVDEAESARRRAQRFIVTPNPARPECAEAPRHALRGLTLDARLLPWAAASRPPR